MTLTGNTCPGGDERHSESQDGSYAFCRCQTLVLLALSLTGEEIGGPRVNQKDARHGQEHEHWIHLATVFADEFGLREDVALHGALEVGFGASSA